MALVRLNGMREIMVCCWLFSRVLAAGSVATSHHLGLASDTGMGVVLTVV